MFYFAYGSCMSPRDLRRTVPDAEMVGPAALEGWRLTFPLYVDFREGGVASIVRDRDSVVEGVLWKVSGSFDALDAREQAPDVYERIKVGVSCRSGQVQAQTYLIPGPAETQFRPSEAYLGLLLEGAQAGVDAEYLKQMSERARVLPPYSKE